MAVYIEANYSKKLGLPQYSSHAYSISVKTELTDLSQLPQASADLYAKLQQAVDTEIVNSGFMPGDTTQASTNKPQASQQVPAQRPQASNQELDGWKCSDKQRDLIIKIVNEHGLDKTEVDKLAQSRFGAGVKQLNKLQASALIDELIETHGSTQRGRGEPQERRGYTRGNYAGRNRS